MSDILRLRTQSEIDEEAAAWVWRLDSNNLSELQRRQFEAWQRRDPRNRLAMRELSKVWVAFDGLSCGAVDTNSADAARLGQVRAGGRRGLWWSLVACGLLCVLGGGIWLSGQIESQTLSTAVGQRRQFTLADGSVVTLNTNSIVQTELKHRKRDVYLQKGEAHFQVAHEHSRPFLVHVADTVVRAVGTEFDVRLHADRRVDIVVNEGRVEVRPAPDPAAGTPGAAPRTAAIVVRALNAGERLSTNSTNSTDLAVIPVTSGDMSAALAWRAGAIVFDGETLAQAIVEISRYTDFNIVLSDPQAAELRVGGRFMADDLTGFFAALQAALPITVLHSEDGSVYIESRR